MFLSAALGFGNRLAGVIQLLLERAVGLLGPSDLDSVAQQHGVDRQCPLFQRPRGPFKEEPALEPLTVVDVQICEIPRSAGGALALPWSRGWATDNTGPASPLSRATGLPMELLQILSDRFGFDAFRPGQTEIVQHVVDGDDALVVMPTGAGKSLCFQHPAIVSNTEMFTGNTDTGITYLP